VIGVIVLNLSNAGDRMLNTVRREMAVGDRVIVVVSGPRLMDMLRRQT